MPRRIVASIALAKLAVHLFANRGYGYFVDELYYLACSRHLDWGYVDQPPLIAALTWLERNTLGESLAAIRFLPAITGALEVALTGWIAAELGGGVHACALASIGESMIVMGDREEVLKGRFENVRKVARVEHPYSMPYQHFDVYYCTDLHQPLQELWPEIKTWN